LDYIEGERRKQWTEGKRITISEKAPTERALDLDNSIRVLGGRIKDLEALAQRLAMGVSPDGPITSLLF
jgi:hypothetical protein